MKKSAIAVGITSVVVLTGCSLSSTPEPAKTIKVTSEECEAALGLAHNLVIDLSQGYIDVAGKLLDEATGTGITTQYDVDQITKEAGQFKTQLDAYNAMRSQCKNENA